MAKVIDCPFHPKLFQTDCIFESYMIKTLTKEYRRQSSMQEWRKQETYSGSLWGCGDAGAQVGAQGGAQGGL